MKRMIDIYATLTKIAVLTQLQYPVANYFYMIGMIAEPVIYLVVWSTVARAQGGQVGGYTPGQFAGYYMGASLELRAQAFERTLMWLRAKHGRYLSQIEPWARGTSSQRVSSVKPVPVSRS